MQGLVIIPPSALANGTGTVEMNEQQAASLHARLRAETAPAHRQLERSLDLLSPPLESGRLVALLIRFHGFHRTWEATLAREFSAPFVPAPRRVLIEQDLQVLGLDAESIGAIPGCAEAISLGIGLDNALGSVYVLEGSTLGGRVIAHHLSRAAWWPATGLRYFDPYGEATASRWRETMAQLAGAGGDPERIVAGAVRTFEVLQQWLVPVPGGLIAARTSAGASPRR